MVEGSSLTHKRRVYPVRTTLSGMAKNAIYLAHDNLHRHRGALKDATPLTHEIIMVESERMLRSQQWHRQRLFFMLSSARHFVELLRSEGFVVHYIKAETTVAGLKSFQKAYNEIIATEPSSFRLYEALRDFGVTFVENDFFLTPRSIFAQWANSQKSLKMENFYRFQRSRLGILMEGDEPVGGRWNFDEDNRLSPPVEPHPWPNYPKWDRDEIDLSVIRELEDFDLVGNLEEESWGTTRTAALAQLDFFLSNAFAEFGPYEDAMPTTSWSVYHSLMSPYMNIGLVTADEIVAAAIERWKRGDIPLSSCEGFIRQIIGWREYINGIYWHFGDQYRNSNHFNSHRTLLPLFSDSSKTKMLCVKTTVENIEERAWVHHIPRLMVLSNLAMLADINPAEFLGWMRRVFVDATDWVMVPNVIGMSLHADGGKMATKPYIAGGAYISRMSSYCGDCPYDPKKRVGEDACPFTTLYWHYLSRNQELLKRNHRMFQQMSNLKRLKDLDATIEHGNMVLDALETGEI